MSIIPGIKMIGGSGKPRLEVIYAQDVYVSVGATTFTGRTAQIAGSPSLAAVRANMRAESTFVSGTQQVPAWAKILSIDDATDTITIEEDGWYPQTPTNAQVLHVNGRIVDLPYCKQLIEDRSPRQLTHELWNDILDAEFRGWEYRCFLDYSQHLYGVVYQDMGPVLNINKTDRLVLIPRKDQKRFNYNVVYDPGSTVRLQRFGYTQAHRESVFAFRGKELVNWPLSSGYGTGFAENYGTQL